MFIVVEGLDGTGKSTTAKALASALNGIFLNTPLDKFKIVRPAMEDIYGDESLARQLFYASTAICSSNRVSQALKEAKCVVIDRYWYSTQVYHSWRTSGQHFQLQEVEDQLVKPDLTVYLGLPLVARKERLAGRDGNTDEDRQTMAIKADKTLNELYRAYADHPFSRRWVEMDASLPTEDIVSSVLSLLGVVNTA